MKGLFPCLHNDLQLHSAQAWHFLWRSKTGGLSVHCTIENNSLQHQLVFQQLEKYLIGFSNGILVVFKHECLLICSVSCCALKHPATFLQFGLSDRWPSYSCYAYFVNFVSWSHQIKKTGDILDNHWGPSNRTNGAGPESDKHTINIPVWIWGMIFKMTTI